VESYARDALERVSSLQSTVNRQAASILASVQYRADGSPIDLSFGNGLTDSRSYDPVGRLIGQIVGNADVRSYGFDAVGNTISKQTSAESDQFGYEALNRLDVEQRTQGSSTASSSFTYDPNGNWLTQTQNGQLTRLSYAADSNRLIQLGNTALTLDPAGNTTSDTAGSHRFYFAYSTRW
jgi:hypothetical protein